jgi:hypothetical protein
MARPTKKFKSSPRHEPKKPLKRYNHKLSLALTEGYNDGFADGQDTPSDTMVRVSIHPTDEQLMAGLRAVEALGPMPGALKQMKAAYYAMIGIEDK